MLVSIMLPKGLCFITRFMCMLIIRLLIFRNSLFSMRWRWSQSWIPWYPSFVFISGNLIKFQSTVSTISILGGVKWSQQKKIRGTHTLHEWSSLCQLYHSLEVVLLPNSYLPSHSPLLCINNAKQLAPTYPHIYTILPRTPTHTHAGKLRKEMLIL